MRAVWSIHGPACVAGLLCEACMTVSPKLLIIPRSGTIKEPWAAKSLCPRLTLYLTRVLVRWRITPQHLRAMGALRPCPPTMGAVIWPIQVALMVPWSAAPSHWQTPPVVTTAGATRARMAKADGVAPCGHAKAPNDAPRAGAKGRCVPVPAPGVYCVIIVPAILSYRVRPFRTCC
jgi:hypothetical protein